MNEPDPFRTLGLGRDATPAEVKRAYRRLAKANHPDAAGESALPRFLAIRAAFDQISGGGPGPTARASREPGSSRPGSAPAGGPWSADPNRAGATHRAYGGRRTRQRPSAPGGPDGTGPTTGAAGDRGAGTAPGASSDPGGPKRTDSGQRPAGPSGSERARTGGTRPDAGPDGDADRDPGRATPGSTSYDGAEREPFEPDWGGASWYGTTSGTYWTLNPKEYADPRKHGPEYQARARRSARQGRKGARGGEGWVPGQHADGPFPPADQRIDDAPTNADPLDDARPSHTTGSWWSATTGPAAAPGEATASGSSAADDGRAHPLEAPPQRAAPEASWWTDSDQAPPTSTLTSASAAAHAWLDAEHPTGICRLTRALVGWAPIALGIGWLVGELTGCSRFSAACDDGAGPLAIVLQLAVLGVLLLLPLLSAIAASATLTTLGGAIPAALLLSATGGAEERLAGQMLLAFVLVFAWAVGLALALWRAVRRPPGASRPVS